MKRQTLPIILLSLWIALFAGCAEKGPTVYYVHPAMDREMERHMGALGEALDDFEVDLPQPARNRVGNKEKEDLVTMIITTVHPGGTKVTGNLLAPLVIDTETRRGIQLTQEDSKYSVRQEINYFKFGLAVKSDSADNGVSEGGNSAADDQVGEIASAQEIDPAETTEPVGVS